MAPLRAFSGSQSASRRVIGDQSMDWNRPFTHQIHCHPGGKKPISRFASPEPTSPAAIRRRAGPLSPRNPLRSWPAP